MLQGLLTLDQAGLLRLGLFWCELDGQILGRLFFLGLRRDDAVVDDGRLFTLG